MQRNPHGVGGGVPGRDACREQDAAGAKQLCRWARLSCLQNEGALAVEEQLTAALCSARPTYSIQI